MPTNQHIRERLSAILRQLNAAHSGCSSLSSASKGTEREYFVELFLKVVLPPFRFGTGDITDAAGNKSGQVDVVIEHGSLPSFPMVGGNAVRLYLAEGVGAAVEVKSDLAKQWEEAMDTGRQVARLRRANGPIPIFLVGYKGWQKLETLSDRALAARNEGVDVRGALILDPPQYWGVSTQMVNQPPTNLDGFGPMPSLPQPVNIPVRADSEMGLLAFIAEVHARASSVLWNADTIWNYVNVTKG